MEIGKWKEELNWDWICRDILFEYPSHRFDSRFFPLSTCPSPDYLSDDNLSSLSSYSSMSSANSQASSQENCSSLEAFTGTHLPNRQYCGDLLARHLDNTALGPIPHHNPSRVIPTRSAMDSGYATLSSASSASSCSPPPGYNINFRPIMLSHEESVIKMIKAAAAPPSYAINNQLACPYKVPLPLPSLPFVEKEKVPVISVIPRLPEQLIGEEAIFFVESGDALPNVGLFVATVQHPDNHLQFLSLRMDMRSTKGPRYFFSFVPRLPGQHVICLKLRVPVPVHGNGNNLQEIEVGGSPKVVMATKDYAAMKNLSYNHIRLGFGSFPLLVKGWGVAVDRRHNNTYLTDRECNEILVIDPRGVIVKRFGKPGHEQDQLWRPTGIAVDEVNSRIIVINKDYHKICVYTMRGDFCFSFGSEGHGDSQFFYPWGVDVSRDGKWIAVADSRNHRIQIFDQRGIFVKKFSVFEVRPFEFKNEFDSPRGIVFDNTGKYLYVSDFNRNVIIKLNFELTTKEEIVPGGVPLNRPQGLAMDPAGNLLICDCKANAIKVIKPDGTFICSLEQTGHDPLVSPTDVAVFSDGKVAVVDNTSRFRVFY